MAAAGPAGGQPGAVHRPQGRPAGPRTEGQPTARPPPDRRAPPAHHRPGRGRGTSYLTVFGNARSCRSATTRPQSRAGPLSWSSTVMGSSQACCTRNCFGGEISRAPGRGVGAHLAGTRRSCPALRPAKTGGPTGLLDRADRKKRCSVWTCARLAAGHSGTRRALHGAVEPCDDAVLVRLTQPPAAAPARRGYWDGWNGLLMMVQAELGVGTEHPLARMNVPDLWEPTCDPCGS